MALVCLQKRVAMVIVAQQNHVVPANRIVVHAIVQCVGMEHVHHQKAVQNVHKIVEHVVMCVEMVHVVQQNLVVPVQMIVGHVHQLVRQLINMDLCKEVNVL